MGRLDRNGTGRRIAGFRGMRHDAIRTVLLTSGSIATGRIPVRGRGKPAVSGNAGTPRVQRQN